MPKAVIYARQSSGAEDYSDSVEQQIENCKRLAEKENLEIVGIYKDLRSSGETYPVGAEETAWIDQAYVKWLNTQSTRKPFRKGLGAVLQQFATSKIEYLIVNELTRLYRPVTGSFLETYINNFIRDQSITLLQVQGGSVDLSKFDQHLITLIKNQILYDDLQKKRMNSRHALKARKDKGLIVNGAKMYGIRYLGHDKVEVIPESIPVIRYVFESIVEYKPYRTIIRACNRKFGKIGFFYDSSIRHIIRQPVYAGYQYDSTGKLIKNRQMTGQEIVPFALWRKAQDVLDEKRRVPVNKAKKHWLPLSGRLICGNCGSRLTCITCRGRILYCCNKATLSDNRVACRKSRILFYRCKKTENALHEAIYPFLLVGFFARYREAKTINRVARRYNRYKEIYNEYQNREDTLLKMFTNGEITKDQYDKSIQSIRPKKEDVNLKLIEASYIEAPKTIFSFEPFWKLFCAIRDGNLTHGEYEDLLNASDVRITVYQDSILVHTIACDVRLPRIQHKNRNYLPAWKVICDARYKTRLSCRTPITICYSTGRTELLAEFNQFKVIGVGSEKSNMPVPDIKTP